MNKKLIVALAVSMVLLGIVPAMAQYDEHSDEGNPWDVSDVHSDHDNGFCDNISGSSVGRDVDCIHRGPNGGPREWSTTCAPEPPWNDLDCTATAVVYCPGLGTGTGIGKDYITFSCGASGGAKVKSGILAGFGAFPLTKGVSCTQGFSNQSVSCGCIQTSTSASHFFGNPTPISVPNYYSCGYVY